MRDGRRGEDRTVSVRADICHRSCPTDKKLSMLGMTQNRPMRKSRREAAAKVVGRSRPGRQELGELFDEAVALYLRLTALAATMYHHGELSGPRRTLLMALARSGPRTVAHLARARAQSRQRLQPLVNALVDEGLLATEPNPLHKQSPLV